MRNAKFTVHTIEPECVHGISPEINNITCGSQKLFLHATIYDHNNYIRNIWVLPDGGNRARCIIRDDIFYSIFGSKADKTELIPTKDRIYTADRGGRVQVIGVTRRPIEFFFANGRFSYLVRPLVVKNFILPCLLGARDLKEMKAHINYENDSVTFGKKKIKQFMEERPHDEETGIFTVQNVTVYPGTMKIIPVRAQDALVCDNMLILPNEEFEDITVASVNPVKSSGLAYTTICNWTDHPITIKAGKKFGTGIIATVQKGQEETGKGYPKKLTKSQFLEKMTEDLQLEKRDNLTEMEKVDLLELLWRYEKVIAKSPNDIGTCKEVQCHIETIPGKTAHAMPRPLPPHLKANLKKQLDDWLDSGVIEPAPPNCPWSSPLVPVKKKNGETRWAVDYRALNQITVKDQRPIPNILERIANLKSTDRKPLRYFGSIDLQSAFNHIEVAEDSRIKTTITTPMGLFTYNKMGFGLF